MVEGVVVQRQNGSRACLESPGQPWSAFRADDTDPARRYIGRVRSHVALARVISLAMTCRRAPSSAPALRTLEILATTRRRATSPVSTLRTPEPDWRSWVPRLVVRARVALALELPLLVLVGVVLAPLAVAGAPLALPVGADHHLETGRPADDAARPVSRGSVCRSSSSLSCSSS